MTSLEKSIEKLSLAEILAEQASKNKTEISSSATTSVNKPKNESEDEGDDQNANPDDVEASPNVHFEPIVHLEAVQVKTNEEEEEVFYKCRAKLFRFDKPSGEWKERGVGELKLLQHKDTRKIRLLMRREQTLKVCGNHAITPDIRLQANVGSDRSWVYSVMADMTEGEPMPELLAVRFVTKDAANEFKEKFEEAQLLNNKSQSSGNAGAEKEEPTEKKEEKSEGKSPENVGACCANPSCTKESCAEDECCKDSACCKQSSSTKQDKDAAPGDFTASSDKEDCGGCCGGH